MPLSRMRCRSLRCCLAFLAVLLSPRLVADQAVETVHLQTDGFFQGLRLAPDGKIIVFGYFTAIAGTPATGIARIDEHGAIDSFFKPMISADSSVPSISDIAFSSGGKMVIAGYFETVNGVRCVAIARLSGDGTLDGGFTSPFNFGNTPILHHLLIDGQDRVLAAGVGVILGAHGGYQNGIIRLNADGSRDSFGVDFGSISFAACLAFQPDEKIMVGLALSQPDFDLFRLNTDGSRDSFHYSESEFNNQISSDSKSDVTAVALQPDGKILVGGKLYLSNREVFDYLVRITSDGHWDSTFHANVNGHVRAIEVDPSGKIVVGGDFTKVNGAPVPGLCRLLADGKIDGNFDPGPSIGPIIALDVSANRDVFALGREDLRIVRDSVSSHVANISTRTLIGAGDDALIAGMIVTGVGEKRVVLRAIGPSLLGAEVNNPITDPMLELRNRDGGLIASNDNWNDAPDKEQIVEAGLAPTNPKESAILTVLTPGSYTAIVRGVGNTTGTGLVEAYDPDGLSGGARLANISTRGQIQAGENVLIGGFIIPVSR